jgi:D-arginine dehydrogenase
VVIETDILIVGAGLAGGATAYHLARCTRARVLVVEKEALAGVHSSGRNAAIVRERVDDPVLQPVMSESASFLRGGLLAAFERRGVLQVGIGEEDVRKYFPRARGVGLWCPDDGTIDVAGLLRAYLAGAQVRFDTSVAGWTGKGGRLRVETSRGEIVCGLLVNAAGPWAGTLGDLPLTPMNRHLFVTTPMDWVDPSWPSVWDGEGGLYFRPESGGLLLSCCDETPAEPGDYHEDFARIEELAGKVDSLQPGLGELSISSTWVGQRVLAPDRRFVIGFDTRNDHVFHVAGLGGHGVTASYAVGRIAARMITERAAEAADPFLPSRLL